MTPTHDHLERESFIDTRRNIISLQGDIAALSRDAEARLDEVMSGLARKREDNLILEREAFLEKVKRAERAELASINKLQRARLQHQRLLTETTAEAFNRQARIEEAHAVKRQEALKLHAETISAIQEAQFKRTEQVQDLLLGQFDTLTTSYASKVTELSALMKRSNPEFSFVVKETREKRDDSGNVITEPVTVQVDEVVKKYFTATGAEFELKAGQVLDELGFVVDEAGKRIIEAGAEIQITRTEETLVKVDKQIEVAVMETSEKVITAVDLATESVKAKLLSLRGTVGEAQAQMFEWQVLHNNAALEAEWRYLEEQKRIGAQRIAANEEVDRRLLALGIAYNDARGRGHDNDFLSGAKTNIEAFKKEMKDGVFGNDNTPLERLKSFGVAFKGLFDTANLWSVENNVLTRMALDNQKKAAESFTEEIFGAGKTFGERLESISRVFTRKDAFGNTHTLKGDRDAFLKALEKVKQEAAETGKPVTYTTTEKAEKTEPVVPVKKDAEPPVEPKEPSKSVTETPVEPIVTPTKTVETPVEPVDKPVAGPEAPVEPIVVKVETTTEATEPKYDTPVEPKTGTEKPASKETIIKEITSTETVKETTENHVEVVKEATTDKELIKALNQKLKAAQKDGSWQEYQQAKMNLEKAKNDPEASEQEKADLERAIAAALDKTGLTETQAEAMEAQQQQKATARAGWANATAILSNIAAKLDGLVDEIALNKGKVDTRLYGSEQNDKMAGSYWSKISFDMSATMMSPLLREQVLIDNIMTAVDKGIARDVQQMGMLETVKEKIATTFDTFDGTMLRLIRIQDTNTTAARLGMESSLNAFLNQMYETTEYLSNLASSVRGNLEEAQALMVAEDAVDFEYQVQKWLGSLSSVGVSDQGVLSIADSLGKLASGDVEGITNGGTGNLLVMAANNANISLADVLADGLDASETNTLLNQMVGYMYDLTVEANGNLVVQQQLAKVFGLTASDLKAATNLIYEYNGKSGQMKTIYNQGTGDTYNQMLGELFARADSMYSRTSLGEMLTNIWENVQYSTAAGMANNPALYLLTKSANILDTFAGGIPIPAITAFGTGVDTKLTVSNIMKTAAMVGGFTQSLVSMIASSISNGGGGFTGSGLLKMVGVQSKASRGTSKSSSGTATVYNASVEDTTESATQSGKDSAKKETASAKEESSEVTNETLNESVLSIYKLLDGVINGNSALRVNIAEPTTIPVKVENVSEFSSVWTQ